MDVFSFVVSTAGGDGVVAPTPEDLRLVDHGPDFYAASVLAQSPWGSLVCGWATEARSSSWCVDDGWSGVLTLPRVITVRADGSLASAPLPALAALRTEPAGRAVLDTLDGLGAQLEFLLESVDDSDSDSASASDLDSALGYGLRLRFGSTEFLDIVVDPARNQMSVDRRWASGDPRADGGCFTVSEVAGLSAAGQQVRGFVDGSVLELFLPGGRVMTTRFYPTTPPPWRLELRPSERRLRLTVWRLSG